MRAWRSLLRLPGRLRWRAKPPLSEAERGPVWRTDGAPDYNRRLVRDAPNAELELWPLARGELRIEVRPVPAGRLFVRVPVRVE